MAKLKSDYVVQHATKTRCAHCNHYVKLLCREDGNNYMPWFYICFICAYVAEVGKGECKYVT